MYKLNILPKVPEFHRIVGTPCQKLFSVVAEFNASDILAAPMRIRIFHCRANVQTAMLPQLN